MDINLSIFLISHHFNRNIFDQVYIQTKGSFMNSSLEGGGAKGGRVKAKACKFELVWKEYYLSVRTRYIRTYCFYDIETF